MRVLKEVLVLAVIVLVFAYAARQLEGVDAGKITSGVPPLMHPFKQLLGWEDEAPKSATNRDAPSDPAEPSKKERSAP